jgi:chorismate-pyruvate lyase
VQVIDEAWVQADAVLAAELRVRLGVWVWRREVCLACGDVPYVHAQSYVSRAGVRVLGLRRLGLRPLGALLFRHGGRVSSGRLRMTLCKPRAGEPWARHGLYQLQGHRVVVYEEFLPGLPPLRA